MSQYSKGTASVTNGSPTVTGTNTLWLANVTAADSFTIAGDGVMYDVASVDSDTQVTLSVNYAGSTASGAVYAIGTSFTVPDNFPEMSQGDIETATIFTRAMRKIQGKFSSILAGGSDANFTAMPQVGGDPIVESGSNADGEFTKWSDGTQICSDERGDAGQHSGSTGVTGLGASDAIWEWTYPSSFVGTVAAVITAGRSNDDVRKFWTTYTVITTSYVRYRTLVTSPTVLTFRVSRIATGRWK